MPDEHVSDLLVSEDGGMCSAWPRPSTVWATAQVPFVSREDFDEWLKLVLSFGPDSKIYIPDVGWVPIGKMRLSNWYVQPDGSIVAAVLYQKYAPLQRRRIDSWMERKGGKQPPPKDRDPPA